MARFIRWYGAGPLHLLVLICSFAITGYAGVRLLAVRPFGVALWFVGAAILHDLILLPLYSVADLSAQAVLRHRTVRLPAVPWLNHLRVPAFLSGVLLLVWFPLIFRLPTPYQAATALSDRGYLGRWLAVTAVLFGASAVALAWRLRCLRRAARDAGGEEGRGDPAAGG